MKIIVNAISGAQEVIEVGESGGYFDESRIIWDERINGSIPNVALGGMVHANGVLEFSQTRMDEHLAALHPPPTAADFDAALTAHLDATAQQRRYDNRITCMVRAGFAGPFQAEGQAFATWGDTCNAFAYALMAEVLAGTAPMPASTADFVAMLPEMVWPG